MNKRKSNRVKVVRKGAHLAEVVKHFPKNKPLKRMADQLALQRLADFIAEREFRNELRRGSAEKPEKDTRSKKVKQFRPDLPRRMRDPEYAAWYLAQVLFSGDIAALRPSVEDFVRASGIFEAFCCPGSTGEQRRIKLMQRLATLINPETLQRKRGESICRALVRAVKDQTDEQLERMVYELESGEPG